MNTSQVPPILGPTLARCVSPVGLKPHVASLKERPDTAALGELLSLALRREPRQRATAKQLRERLRALGPRLRTAKWPLAT